MKRLRSVFAASTLAVAVFGMAALLSPVSMAGKGGKGGGGGPPVIGNPPDCPCEEVIVLAPGVTCYLDWRVELVPGGFECGYACTFPF